MARHYSRPGTFEAIRKEVIEDPTWPPAAFRLALWLAAKPDGWVLRAKQLADGTGLKESTVIAAIRELRRRGLVYDEQDRGGGGRFGQVATRFRRGLVVACPWQPDDDEDPVRTAPAKNEGAARGDHSHTTAPAKNEGAARGKAPGRTAPAKTAAPVKNRRADSNAVTSQDVVSAQVAPPPQKIAPNREDGIREDGTDLPDPTGPATDLAVLAGGGNQDGPGLTAQTLVAEWLEHCDERPPSRIIGQISKHLKHLLDHDRIAYERVRQGLALWHQKGDQHPATLDSFVHAAMNGSAGRPRKTSRAEERERTSQAADKVQRALDEGRLHL